MQVTCPNCGFSAHLGEPVEGTPLCPRCRAEIFPPGGPGAAEGELLPAWEHKDAFLDLGAMLRTITEVLFSPGRVFSRLGPTPKYGAALVFFILTALVGGVGNQFSKQVLAAFTGGEVASPLKIGLTVLALVFILPVLAPVAAFALSGMVHLGLRMVRAASGGFAATFRVVTYVGGATNLFNVVPFLGPVAGTAWGMVAQVLGFRAAHRTTVLRSSVGLLLGGVIFVVGVTGLILLMGINARALLELVGMG